MDKVKKCKSMCTKDCASMAYTLGMIGALVYYISTAGTFWVGVLGVIKAIIWPVFVVYGLLDFLG